jgi:hypothetical protein
MADALSEFISAMCRADAGELLEFTSWPAVMTAPLVETDTAARLTIVAKYVTFAEALRVILTPHGISTCDAETVLRSGSFYSSIVCAPSIGSAGNRDRFYDGFGGEIIRSLVPHLAEMGTIYWITSRAAISSPRAKKTIQDLAKSGCHLVACVEAAPGALTGTLIEAAVLAFRRDQPNFVFVGALRDHNAAEPLAAAFLSQKVRKNGPLWNWLERSEFRTYSEIERSQLLHRLIPRGGVKMERLGNLLLSAKIEKADRSISDDDPAATFLYFPEYAGSQVTATLEDQTVQPKAVYRLRIDPQKVNAQFLARLFNAPYGKMIRAQSAHGATIQRVSSRDLLDIPVPLPDGSVQDRIVRIAGDVSLLKSAIDDVQGAIEHDWASLSDVEEQMEELKSVLNIERRIAEWSSVLPYPLATVYRRYCVNHEPKERLDALLQFFEITAVYLSTMGTSYVRALRSDWQEVMGKWLYPKGGTAIDRSDFGFWVNLSAASLKDVKRVFSDVKLRKQAEQIAGPDLVQQCEEIGRLADATRVLEVARNYRNSWKGHGGFVSSSDAERLVGELQQSVRDLYEVTSSVFRHVQLVRPGLADIGDNGASHRAELLTGSDSEFHKQQIDVDQTIKSSALALWKLGSRAMCRAMPFFRLGTPKRPQEKSCYVYNRIDGEQFRWVSYQEAQEQEVFATDHELLALIRLGRESGTASDA